MKRVGKVCAPSGRAEKVLRCECRFPKLGWEYLVALHCSMTVLYHEDDPVAKDCLEAKDSKNRSLQKWGGPTPP